MDTIDQKGELNINFRLEVLNNVIIKKLKEYTENIQNPDILLKINELAYKLEEKMFNKATSKEDYVVRILHKLNFAKSKLVDALREPHLGSQMHTTDVAQPACTNQAQQNLDGTRSLLERDNDLIPNDARVLQNHVFEHQNVVPYENRYQSIKEHNSMLQQPRLSNPSAISKARGKQIENTWLRGTKRPSSSLDWQNVVAKKCKPQSQCESLNAHNSADYAQSLDGEWKSLIVKFKRARLVYLPELLKLQERADTHDSQEHEPVHNATISMQQMIEFLYMPESELGRIPNDTADRCLDHITMYCYALGTKDSTGANQALQQFSDERVCLNNMQTTPSVKQTLLRDQALPFSSINEKGSLGINENRQVRVSNMQNAPSVKPTLLKDQGLPFSSINEKRSLGINENRQVRVSNMQNAPSVKPTLLIDQGLPFSSINERGSLGINEIRQVRVSNMQNVPSMKPTLLKDQALPFSSMNEKGYLGINENRQVRVSNMQTAPLVKPTLLKDQSLPFSRTNEKGSMGITENRQVYVNNMQTMRSVKPTLLKDQTPPFSSVKRSLLGITENRHLPSSSINEKGSQLGITENSLVCANNLQTIRSVRPTLLKDQSLPSSTITAKGSSLKIIENRQVQVNSVFATAIAAAKLAGNFPAQTDQHKKSESMLPPMTVATAKLPDHFPDWNQRVKSWNSILPPTSKAAAKLPEHFLAQTNQNQKVESMNSTLLPTITANAKLSQPVSAQTDSISSYLELSDAPLETNSTSGESIPPLKYQVNETPCGAKTGIESDGPSSPELLASLFSVDSNDSDNNQNPHNAKHTFDRLYQSVQLITKDAMWDSMDDIVFMDYADELPAYAANDDPESAKNRELANTCNAQEN